MPNQLKLIVIRAMFKLLVNMNTTRGKNVIIKLKLNNLIKANRK